MIAALVAGAIVVALATLAIAGGYWLAGGPTPDNPTPVSPAPTRRPGGPTVRCGCGDLTRVGIAHYCPGGTR